MPATAARFAEWFATDGDATRYTVTATICNLLAYGHLLLAAFGPVPAWTLALTIPVLVPRWMIAVHELFHLRTDREVDRFTRLLPFVFSPLSVGYREQLVNHRSHHRHMATRDDAEYYQLRGSPLTGLVNAFTAPEQLWWRWVAENGIDRQLVLGTVLRLAVFMGLILVGGYTFLWYWIPARVAFGGSYFIFFYALHRRGDAYGVYPLPLPGLASRLSAAIWGGDVVLATQHHDVHHAQPRIAARYLATARRAVLGE